MMYIKKVLILSFFCFMAKPGDQPLIKAPVKAPIAQDQGGVTIVGVKGLSQMNWDKISDDLISQQKQNMQFPSWVTTDNQKDIEALKAVIDKLNGQLKRRELIFSQNFANVAK